MDFFYEQSNKSKEDANIPETDAKTEEINKKTNENFQLLENEISNTFNLFSSKASSFWSNNISTNKTVNSLIEQTKNLKIDEKLGEIKNNLKIDETFDQIKTNINTNLSNLNNEENQKRLKDLSTKTNSYLDDLDKELETVENFATGYALKLGSFLKNSVSINDPSNSRYDLNEENGDELIDEKEAGLLFNVNDDDVSYYSKFNFNDTKYLEFLKTFKINHDEVVELLKDEELRRIYDSVQNKLSDEQFWSIYYYRDAKRKSIKNLNEGEEDVNWDDDDEEEEKNPQTTRSSESTIGTVSIDGNTVEVVKSNEKKDTKKKEQVEEEESDDDWE